jgi:hypothetical protein
MTGVLSRRTHGEVFLGFFGHLRIACILAENDGEGITRLQPYGEKDPNGYHVVMITALNSRRMIYG